MSFMPTARAPSRGAAGRCRGGRRARRARPRPRAQPVAGRQRRRRERAPSTLARYPLAKAVDGARPINADFDYWNDGTQGVYGDWVAVSWTTTRQLGHVTLRLPVLSRLDAPRSARSAELTLEYLDGSTPGERSRRPTASQPGRQLAGAESGRRQRDQAVLLRAGRDQIDPRPLRRRQQRRLGLPRGAGGVREQPAAGLRGVDLVAARRGAAVVNGARPDRRRRHDDLRARRRRPLPGPVDARLGVRAGGRPGVDVDRREAEQPSTTSPRRSAPTARSRRSSPRRRADLGPHGDDTDNAQFLVKAAWEIYRVERRHRPLQEGDAGGVAAAMNGVPRDATTGLVWIDPATPHSSYGFTDSIVKTGNELFCSLLYVEASKRLEQLYTAAGDSRSAATWARARAPCRPAWRRSGTARPASSTRPRSRRGPDVWGSAYAVVLGLATPTQQASIAGWPQNPLRRGRRERPAAPPPGGVFWNAIFDTPATPASTRTAASPGPRPAGPPTRSRASTRASRARR